jgi:glycosyltransferase involved in cell wall biosynthesis
MGGPALHVSYLSKGLQSRGYDTTLVSGRLARGEDTMDFVAQELGIRPVTVPSLHRDVSPLYDAVAVSHLVREIRRIRPQILHTHTAKAGAVGRTAALLSGEARPPVIVHTFHGHVLRGYFDPFRTRFFMETERALARHTTKLIAVGPQVRDDLVDLGIAPADRFTVIRLGIDLEGRVLGADQERAGMRRLLGLPDSRFVVGWIGRMTAIKRVPDVVRAFQGLIERGIDAALVLVGDGPDREDVETVAAELGVARRTYFLGYQRDVRPYYAMFDTLVLPSANEGTPVVAIEALAAGRPVVATRVGGVPDVVTDGKDGILVEPDNVEALTDALATLAVDPALREQYGRAGRDAVVPRYRVTRLVDDVDSLYRKLLSERHLPLPASGTP